MKLKKEDVKITLITEDGIEHIAHIRNPSTTDFDNNGKSKVIVEGLVNGVTKTVLILEEL